MLARCNYIQNLYRKFSIESDIFQDSIVNCNAHINFSLDIIQLNLQNIHILWYERSWCVQYLWRVIALVAEHGWRWHETHPLHFVRYHLDRHVRWALHLCDYTQINHQSWLRNWIQPIAARWIRRIFLSFFFNRFNWLILVLSLVLDKQIYIHVQRNKFKTKNKNINRLQISLY